MFSRVSSAFKMRMLSKRVGAGDYETMEEIVAVRSTKEATRKAEDLLSSAHDLAESGASPLEAVAALRGLGPSEETADLALGLLRLTHFPFELRNANTAWRYLVAVKHRRDVAQPSAEESQQIERIESLARLDPASAYERLTTLEPRLSNVQDLVDQQSSQWDGSNINRDGFLKIDEMLAPYLGPESNQRDPLLRSRYARHVARMHLVSLAELLGED